MTYTAIAILAYLTLLSWVCGANDGINPASTGHTRGAWLIQHSPVYLLALWLYEPI